MSGILHRMQMLFVGFASVCMAPALVLAQGNSIGQPNDPRTLIIPESVSRYYFAGDDHFSSVKENALGDMQVMFYDIYPPSLPTKDLTIVFVHGGGYQQGAANSTWQGVNVVENMSKLAREGYWVISMEYRRGWRGDGGAGVTDAGPSAADYDTFLRAIELAKEDVLEGWAHADTVARLEKQFPDNYALIGSSAGGSIVSRVTITNPALDKKVAGVIVGFGVHSVNEFALPFENLHRFPVVIQGGLMDPIQPAYSNHPWFDPSLPIGKGLFNFYEELKSHGYPVRLYMSAQQGHGFGAYMLPDRTAEYFPWALQFFEEFNVGTADTRPFVEFKFARADSNYPEIQPGQRINTLERPGFRYEPYQSLLQTGLNPSELELRR